MRIRPHWRIADQDRSAASALMQSLNLPRPIANLLVQRGFTSEASAHAFLMHAPEQLADPLSLTDMARAADRIRRARDAREHVLVFGDYDVDGICATALLVRALRRFGIAHCSYAMPNRLTEGYGLGTEHVAIAREQGVSLIITVDNGISALEPARLCRALGIDLIVTDHHEIGPELPDAFAIVNPKREAEAHPSAHLSGSAVACKLAHALTGELDDLDLAALGLVADIVPLRGENRTLVALGLASIARAPKPGIRALAQTAKLAMSDISSETVAFQLAPRINAGGRLGDGLAGLELLLTDSADAARAIAESLDAANQERRAIEKTITGEALEMAQAGSADRVSTVLASHDWHPGVIGIVAAKVMHAIYRPTILVAVDSDGIGRGSGRSVPEVDLVAALSVCQEHLAKFGGHKAAAGITIEQNKLEVFANAFDAAVRTQIDGRELHPVLSIDAQVALGEIDAALVAALDRLQPFGQGNPAPIFCTFGAPIARDSIRELRGGHLKLMLQDNRRIYPVIGFGMAQERTDLLDAGRVDVAFTPKLNTWQGESSVQLLLKDIRPAM